jgi:hypothetical protein
MNERFSEFQALIDQKQAQVRLQQAEIAALERTMPDV